MLKKPKFQNLLQFIVALLVFIVIFATKIKTNINEQEIMKRITRKEEEILSYFWRNGPMFVREVLELQANPKPHYNTLSTIVRTLEEKGYIGYKTYGNTHQYYALVSEDDYRKASLGDVVDRYFDSSYTRVVSTLIKEEKLSIDELQELIRQINNQ